jgi:hypothetical protein
MRKICPNLRLAWDCPLFFLLCYRA